MTIQCLLWLLCCSSIALRLTLNGNITGRTLQSKRLQRARLIGRVYRCPCQSCFLAESAETSGHLRQLRTHTHNSERLHRRVCVSVKCTSSLKAAEWTVERKGTSGEPCTHIGMFAHMFTRAHTKLPLMRVAPLSQEMAAAAGSTR